MGNRTYGQLYVTHVPDGVNEKALALRLADAGWAPDYEDEAGQPLTELRLVQEDLSAGFFDLPSCDPTGVMQHLTDLRCTYYGWSDPCICDDGPAPGVLAMHVPRLGLPIYRDCDADGRMVIDAGEIDRIVASKVSPAKRFHALNELTARTHRQALGLLRAGEVAR